MTESLQTLHTLLAEYVAAREEHAEEKLTGTYHAECVAGAALWGFLLPAADKLLAELAALPMPLPHARTARQQYADMHPLLKGGAA